jgi:hypothetical protein
MASAITCAGHVAVTSKTKPFAQAFKAKYGTAPA